MTLASLVKHLDNRCQMSRGIKMTLMLRRVLEKGIMAQTQRIQCIHIAISNSLYRTYILRLKNFGPFISGHTSDPFVFEPNEAFSN